ncbi:MAG TPA: sn-glycerol-3-phosphate ABC transporter substrate-binding protein UgpB [Burkholderiales bacterium]|nr:sn-glycerol-3-phosphate ABC transporter substrate-binding protein UgpB [Burkholderiales bacterium]
MRSILFALVLACAAGVAHAATEIRLWHEMSGARGDELAALVQQFNAAQKAYRVVAVYKGSDGAALSAALVAQRARRAPDLVQVDEVDTGSLLAEPGAVRPLWEVMRAARERLDARAFLPAVASPFLDARGRLLALPFDTSTPVMFYNRDAFRKAGLDPDRPPQTWYQMMKTLGAIVDSGVKCAYTTAWPSWVELENMTAWNNRPFATLGNGFHGLGARLDFNTRLMMRHIAMLESFAKSGYFTYSGRGDAAEARFADGGCAVLTSSSSSILRLKRAAKFDLGVAQFPYYDDMSGAPQNTLVRGGALWVMSGKSFKDERGVAKFLAYLLQPRVQAQWHQQTGYLPVTRAAYQLSERDGFYERFPGEQIAVRQLLKNPTPESRGIRLGPLRAIRLVIDQELEAVWADKKTPMDALDAAVKRGNVLLHAFMLAHSGHHPARRRLKLSTERVLPAERYGATAGERGRARKPPV